MKHSIFNRSGYYLKIQEISLEHLSAFKIQPLELARENNFEEFLNVVASNF